MWCDDALCPLVERAEDQSGLALAGTDENRDSMNLRESDVRAQGDDVSADRAPVEEDEVQAGDGEHPTMSLARVLLTSAPTRLIPPDRVGPSTLRSRRKRYRH